MVYIILGKGFEPMEAVAPCDILRRGGVDVRFAGIGGTLIEGGHGICVQADCTVEEMKLEYAPDLNTALDRAYADKGRDAHLVVIPNGISVIVEP